MRTSKPHIPCLWPPSAARLAIALATIGASLTWLFATSFASAQDATETETETPTDGEVITVEATGPSDRERDVERALSEPALVSRIRVDDSIGGETSVAEVIGKAVGAEVRSVGGLGGFASVSVRGLGAGHTPVLVDGVPLSRVSTVTADLSRFELGGFSMLELYRGSVPSSLGASGMGGALNLVSAVGVPEHGYRSQLTLGVGSFGARHIRARLRGGDDVLAYQLGAGYSGADGDYTFFNDNGTNLNTSDDTMDKRTNNGFDRVDAVLRAREARGPRLVTGGARIIAKRQGLPGIGSRQTNRATLEGFTGVLDTTLLTTRGETSLRGQGFAIIDRQSVLDDESEIGIGAGDSTSDTVSVGVGAAMNRQLTPRVTRATASIDLRGDWFKQRGGGGQSGMRSNVALATEASLKVSKRAVLVPQLRALISRTDAAGMTATASKTDLDVNPRLAAVYRATTSLTVKASAGYAVRQPTLIEMFGDRGFLAGNPEIRGERGPSADAALVFAPLPTTVVSLPIDEALFEAALFVARTTDAIVYAPSAAGVARPFNVDGARLSGGELTASLRIAKLVRATSNYTFLSAVQRSDSKTLDGNALPHRSRHQAYAQLALELGRVSGWTELTFASGNFTDQANIIELPSRTFWGAGLRVKISPRFSLSGEAKNLANNIVESIELDPAPRPDLARIDRPVSDFFGYPLPGRAFYLTLAAQL